MSIRLADLSIAALWLAWLIYWRLSAIGVKRTARRESLRSSALHVAPLWIAGVLLFLRSDRHGGVLFERFVPAGPLPRAIAVALVAAGLAFAVWARVHLGANWSATVTVKQRHELVCTGPYATVRHPIYSGILLALIGTALARGQWRGVLAVALAFGAFWYKLRLEERWMLDTFGEQYRRYRSRTRALIPFLL